MYGPERQSYRLVKLLSHAASYSSGSHLPPRQRYLRRRWREKTSRERPFRHRYGRGGNDQGNGKRARCDQFNSDTALSR